MPANLSRFLYNGQVYIIGTSTRPGTASLYRPSTAAIGYRCIISLREQFVIDSEVNHVWNCGNVQNFEEDLTNISIVARIDTLFTRNELTSWQRILGV